jgi:hypothetical protein
LKREALASEFWVLFGDWLRFEAGAAATRLEADRLKPIDKTNGYNSNAALLLFNALVR